MTFVDDRGRLFGKVNLIDAGVGILVLLLIPLGYAAYALFRTPVPIITTVARVPVPGGKGYRLRVLGEDFRPYLKVALGSQSATFLVESPNAGEVRVPELEPGTYDLVLYDEAQELTRIRGALVIDAPFSPAPPMGTVKVLGWFTGLDRKAALTLASARNEPRPSPLRFLPLPPPEPDLVPIRSFDFLLPTLASRIDGLFRVNAVVILRCTLVGDDCTVSDTPVRPGAVVQIPYAGSLLRFRVEEVHSAATELIDVRVRVVTPPEILAVLRAEAAGADSSTEDFRLTPWFVSFEETISGTISVEGTQIPEEVSIVRAVLRVPADRTVAGWKYQGRPLRAGETFTFETSQHVIRGLIMNIRASQ